MKVFNDSQKIEFLMCCPLHVLVTQIWQSQVEIEHYSVAYFDHVRGAVVQYFH